MKSDTLHFRVNYNSGRIFARDRTRTMRRNVSKKIMMSAPSRVETSALNGAVEKLVESWRFEDRREETIATFLDASSDALRDLETRLEKAGENSQLSLSQLRMIYTVIELLMLWGVYGANKRTRSFVPRRNTSTSFESSLRNQISFKRCDSDDSCERVLKLCEFITSFLQRPHFLMMLPRYLLDVLAMTLHLSLASSETTTTIRKAAAQQLNSSLRSLPQQLRLETLLSIMTSVQSGAKRFRARLGTILSHELQQNGAVVIVVGFFLGHISSQNRKGSEGESRVARLIATPALQNHSRDAYFSKIAPQILSVLRTCITL